MITHNQSNIFITGMGVTTAIGENTAENLFSLKKGESGISQTSILDSVHASSYPTGEIKLTNEQLAKQLRLPENSPRTLLLGVKAARESFGMARLETAEKAKIALIGATTVGGMDITEKNYLQSDQHPEFILSHSGGAMTEQIAKILGVSGIISTFNTACSSSANAIIYGARLIKAGRADIVIAGGFDALTKFTINGFKTLMILSEKKCQPFDAARQGLNLGEGAGFVVLESEESVKRRGIPSLCKLGGYANTNDAFHATATSPEGKGAYMSMMKAIEDSGISIEDIDYINAHGTGTENNDATEAAAIKRIFNSKVPAFSSTKGYTGHTLAAAGGVEAVYSILSIQENIVFPNLNFTTPMEELNISPVKSVIKNQKIVQALSNSFGFGGNDSSIIFQKV